MGIPRAKTPPSRTPKGPGASRDRQQCPQSEQIDASGCGRLNLSYQLTLTPFLSIIIKRWCYLHECMKRKSKEKKHWMLFCRLPQLSHLKTLNSLPIGSEDFSRSHIKNRVISHLNSHSTIGRDQLNPMNLVCRQITAIITLLLWKSDWNFVPKLIGLFQLLYNWINFTQVPRRCPLIMGYQLSLGVHSSMAPIPYELWLPIKEKSWLNRIITRKR